MKDYIYQLRVLHGKVFDWYHNTFPLYLERFKNPKAVYLVLTPEHDNLGDHAIAQAEIQLLSELEIPYIEYTEEKIKELKRNGDLRVLNGRPILACGGGNMGTLWFYHEELFRSLISSCPKSKIILLPNSIYYENSAWGRDELENSRNIYNSHGSLKLYARELVSFNIMKRNYKNVAIAPDMVLRMNYCNSDKKREGCILCLRNDLEKTLTIEQEKIIHEQLSEIFGSNIKKLDMAVGKKIKPKDREVELEKQYEAFRCAELVVTDRLHGMIFSVITGTPCVVIDSKSHKLRGTYEWIKELDYVEFCDDQISIIDKYKRINRTRYNYDNNKLLPFYEELRNDLIEITRK